MDTPSSSLTGEPAAEVRVEEIYAATEERKSHTHTHAHTQATHFNGKHIKWKNVSFRVGEKQILQECFGEVHAGETCILLGPSGSGKTSLLNILAGRQTSRGNKHVSGYITVDGEEINPLQYRRQIAYCMQDDALLAYATPRECVTFSARLRLASLALTEEQLSERVERVISSLSLQSCADRIVGNHLVKGISGGERKRTSVAVEIVTEPNIIFLDEPTSGLDSHSAYRLGEALVALARQHCTVLCTIHQPSSLLFSLFDRCIFLTRGEVVYEGPVKDCLSYFADRGRPCPVNHNPADFVLSLCHILDVAKDTHIEYKHIDAETQNTLSFATPSPGFLSQFPATHNTSMSFQFSHSSFTVEAPFLLQISTLVHREWQKTLRDKGANFAKARVTIMLNVLIGCVFLYAASKEQHEDAEGFAAHVGALTIIAMFNLVGIAQGMILYFPYEMPMVMREYSTGTYGMIPYYIARLLVEVPIVFLQDLVQMCILYWMLDLQGSFIYLLVTCYGLALVSNSVGMLLCCVTNDIKKASELITVVYMPQIILSGFFIRTSLIPPFLRWAQYLAGMKYALSLLFLIEFDPESPACRVNDQAHRLCVSLLESNELRYDLVWFYALMLGVLFVCFRFLSAIVLWHRANTFAG